MWKTEGLCNTFLKINQGSYEITIPKFPSNKIKNQNFSNERECSICFIHSIEQIYQVNQKLIHTYGLWKARPSKMFKELLQNDFWGSFLEKKIVWQMMINIIVLLMLEIKIWEASRLHLFQCFKLVLSIRVNVAVH